MAHHAQGFISLGGSETLIRQIAEDYTSAEIDPADSAMLGYAAKLTREPWEITKQDTDILREHGFDDRGIHDITQVAAYFNYVNRVADGLGVELEDYHEDKWRE